MVSPTDPPGLTPEQLESFHTNGFLAIPNYLSSEEIDAVLSTSQELLNGFDLASHPLTKFTTGDDGSDAKHVGDDYFLSSGDKVRFFFEPDAISEATGELTRPKHTAINKVGHSLHTLSPPFSAVTQLGRVGGRNAAIAASLGFQDPWVLQSMLICKQPSIGGAVPSHRDSEFLYTDPPSAVGWWYALQDAGVGNATLSFAKGSHKGAKGGRIRRRFVRAAPEVGGTEFVENEGPGLPKGMEEEEREVLGAQDEDFEIVEVKAGTLVLIHGNVLHKSEKNTSPNSRYAYTFHVIEGAEGWEYDKRNWLQPPNNGDGFTRLYGQAEA